MSEPVRLGVLVSGGGTTLQNFIDKIAAGTLNARISVVISSTHKAHAIRRAKNHGLPCETILRAERPLISRLFSRYETSTEYSRDIAKILDQYNVDLVAMAGFLKLWTIPARYLGRVLNIHPALIPAFCGDGMYGHRVHEAVIASGVKVSGCTVHFADNEYDTGPIILQRTVPVLFEDTPGTLAARVFEQECIAYPEAVNLFAAGKLLIVGRRVQVSP